MDPATSRSLGIAAIYQQPALFPDLTVAENIALALEQRRRVAARALDERAPHRRADLLDRVGRVDRSRAARRDADDARAAAGRDRQGDRRATPGS